MTGQELIDFIKSSNAEDLPICIFKHQSGPVALTWRDVEVLQGDFIIDITNPQNRTFSKYFGIGAATFLQDTPTISGDGLDLPEAETVLGDPRKTMSFKEIVDDLVGRMDVAAKQTWLNVTKDQLIEGHHTTGRNIRNDYGLWTVGNPVVNTHPDVVSMEIMEAVWTKLNN